jgi:hypothetical protein
LFKKKQGNSYGPNFKPSLKWGLMFYLLLPIWTRKNMAIGHLPTHLPSTMFNNFDGGREEMSTM